MCANGGQKGGRYNNAMSSYHASRFNELFSVISDPEASDAGIDQNAGLLRFGKHSAYLANDGILNLWLNAWRRKEPVDTKLSDWCLERLRGDLPIDQIDRQC